MPIAAARKRDEMTTKTNFEFPNDKPIQTVLSIRDTGYEAVITISDKEMTVNAEALRKALNDGILSNEQWLEAWLTVAAYYNKLTGIERP